MDIKKVIKAKGWTTTRLALEMTNKEGTKGVSQASVSQIINGNPTLDKLKEIASVIGISVSELLRDEDEQTTLTCPHCGKELHVHVNLS